MMMTDALESSGREAAYSWWKCNPAATKRRCPLWRRSRSDVTREPNQATRVQVRRESCWGLSNKGSQDIEPFILKDYHVNYNEKHDIPSLSDEVSRLIYIHIGDCEVPSKDVEGHCQQCQSGERVYFHTELEQKTGAVLNILGDVLALCSGSYYSQTSTLSATQKADAEKLLECAYRKWGEVKAFDDQNRLQQHLAGLSTNMDPSLW